MDLQLQGKRALVTGSTACIGFAAARLLAAEGASHSAVAEPGRAGFPLPDTVRETVRRRFDPLDRETVAVLEAAAVVGREFRLATI